MKKKQVALVLAGSILMTNVISYAEIQNVENLENLKGGVVEEFTPSNPDEHETNFTDNTTTQDETSDEEVLADPESDILEEEAEEVDNQNNKEDDNYFNDFLNDFFQNDNSENVDDTPVYNTDNSGLGDFIFNYEDESFDYFDPGNNNNNNNFFNFDDVDEDPTDTSSNIGTMKVKKDRQPTIQYSLFSRNGVPIFIDTGLEINKDKTINRVNMEELLRQISIKKQGRLFKDKESFLLYINNDTLVITEKMFNTNGLEEAFQNHDIEFKFSKSQAGRRSDLVDLLATKGDIPVYIDGEKISLSVKPEVSNELYVVFPIREIVENLDGKVSWNKDKEEVIISKANKVIKINNASNIVTINGKKYKLTAPAKLNNEAGKMLSLLSLIVDELDGIAYYDAQMGAITINSKK